MVLGQGSYLDTVCFKNFDEIALSCTVKETEAIWGFALFVTNLKTDNDPHFWEGQFFLQIGSVTQQSYPVGPKFC